MLCDRAADILISGIAHIAVDQKRILIVKNILDRLFDSFRSRNVRIAEAEVIDVVGAVNGSHLLALLEHRTDDGTVGDVAFHFLGNHIYLLKNRSLKLFHYFTMPRMIRSLYFDTALNQQGILKSTLLFFGRRCNRIVYEELLRHVKNGTAIFP